jgi:hypothetical protein
MNEASELVAAKNQSWLGGNELVVTWSPASNDMSMEAEESLLLDAITKQQPVNTITDWDLVCVQ